MAHVKIETIKNGPYIVTGEVELIDSDGNRFPEEKRMALCRCGASTKNQFSVAHNRKSASKPQKKRFPNQKNNNFLIRTKSKKSEKKFKLSVVVGFAVVATVRAEK